MARSIGLIPDKVIRYTCLTECATLLNVNEQIILDEIKKHLLQRDDNYLEQIKKEKDASATTSSLPPADTPFPAGSIPPADMPPLAWMIMFPLRFLLQKQKRDINRIFPKKDGKSTFFM